jgi:hypothetical protein
MFYSRKGAPLRLADARKSSFIWSTKMSVKTSATTATRMALLVIAMSFALGSAAHAAATRTFVSGAGSDGNAGSNCARTSPCRSLTTASTVTSPGGEIIALDPAGYGTISISGPIVLTGVPGAAITVPTGQSGVAIAAGATDKIIIRNFEISGAGASSTTGISVTSGLLAVENCLIDQLTAGLSTATKADITDSDFVGNGTALVSTGVGVNISNGQPYPNGAPNIVRIARGSIVDNTTAFAEQNPGANGTCPNCYTNATFFLHSPGNTWSTDVTGNTNLLSTSGTGTTGGQFSPGVQNYVNSSAPN